MTSDERAFGIIRLGAQGDGVAEGPDGELYFANALPGERVRRDPQGQTILAGPASADRRHDPLCPHVPACGGCSVQHMSDGLYRAWKGRLLSEALVQRGIMIETAPLLMTPLRSRRRATLTGQWQDGTFGLGFRGAGSHRLEPLRLCAILSPAITDALPLLSELAAGACRRDKEVRVAVLAADNGLDVAFSTDGAAPAGRLAELARLAATGGIIRLTVNGAPVAQLAAPEVTIAGVAVTPPPGAFLQATAEAEAMLASLVLPVLAKAKARRLADLFCGLGTISLALARTARVTAVDSDAGLLAALGAGHARARGLKPIQTLRRDLFRDPLSPGELKSFDAVVLDPPRAGAKAQAEALARADVGCVIMVSCNPATLARDLRILVDGGFVLDAATPIDQFLFTAHLEAVAVLRRP